MAKRVINFYAGPAGLPLPALERAQAELLDFSGTGMSVMEISHRSKEYEAVHNEAIALTKELLSLPANYKILFLQGGGHLQFGMLPMNLLYKGRKADYICTGSWADKAYKEGKIVAGETPAASPPPRRRSSPACRARRRSRSTPTASTCTSPRTTPSRAPSSTPSPRRAASPWSATCPPTSCGSRST